MNKSSYFQYNWIKYLFIIIVPLIFWIIIYSDIDQVQADECVKILYIGDSLDEDKFQDNIYSQISSITSQKLEYISVISYHGEKDSAYEYIRNKIYSVDIVIISDEYYDEEVISQIFIPLTIRLKGEFINTEFIKIEENSYGLKILQNSFFYEFCNDNEGVSIFLSQYSLNIGKAYGYGKEENDSAISIVKYMLGVN